MPKVVASFGVLSGARLSAGLAYRRESLRVAILETTKFGSCSTYLTKPFLCLRRQTGTPDLIAPRALQSQQLQRALLVRTDKRTDMNLRMRIQVTRQDVCDSPRWRFLVAAISLCSLCGPSEGFVGGPETDGARSTNEGEIAREELAENVLMYIYEKQLTKWQNT
jgi:hypothetical protein